MEISCVAFTHQGLVRQNNEDCILCDGWMRNRPMASPLRLLIECNSSCPSVFALSDGLGGHLSGEVASQFVVSKIGTAVAESTELSETFLTQMLLDAHKGLFDLSCAVQSYREMGATVAGLSVDSSGAVHLFHVGDSRVYRREDRYLQQLTKDDRPEPGEYGESDTESQTKTTLLQCLGGLSQFSEIEPHVSRFEMSDKPEVFLLCSDGLSDMLTQDEIEESISDSHEETVRTLFDKVCKAGAKDNVSILIVEILPEGSSPEPAAVEVLNEIPGVQP